MPDYEQGYAGTMAMDSPKQLAHRPKLDRLKDARKQLEIRLEDVNKAIAMLEGNPQLNDFLNLMEKVNY